VGAVSTVKAVSAVKADIDILEEIEIGCSMPFLPGERRRGTKNSIDTLVIVERFKQITLHGRSVLSS
jgi:hypothetical protein